MTISRIPLHHAIPLLAVFAFVGSLTGCTSSPRSPGSPAPPRAPATSQARTPLASHRERFAGDRCPVHFVERAHAAGLHYVWKIPGKRPLNVLQAIGNGCAFLDYNNDGNLDILLVGSKLALYRGDGHGHFADVTAQTGLDKLNGHFLGCAVGDYDNDGYDDVYVSGYGEGRLLHNEALSPDATALAPHERRKYRGGGTRTQQSTSIAPLLDKERGWGEVASGRRAFRDVTGQAGLTAQPWGTSCGFADVDGDGWLDLYVCNYLEFNAKTPQLCPEHGVLTNCSPHYYHALHGVLYHNLGGKHFEEVTKVWGVKHTGNGLGVAFADFDGSGRVGFAIANDELGSDLLQNLGAGHMKNINVASGTVGTREGGPHGGMGIDWGDADNDGKFDFFVTTYQNEAKTLYHNEGDGLFKEISDVAGIEAVTLPYVAFGCKFLDADNDGWLDLLIANGHIEDNTAQITTATTYRQPLQFLHNLGRHPLAFADSSADAGLTKMSSIVGRGLAIGDYDNDGRVDALVVNAEGEPLLLHNETPSAGNWLGVRLIGSSRATQGTLISNRDALGAVLTATFGGHTQVQQCQTGGSYLSASDRRVHFGLGKAKRIETLTVRWPDGRATRLTNLTVNRILTLREDTL